MKKNYIELTEDVSLTVGIIKRNKVNYLFKIDGNEGGNYEGVIPSSLTKKMTVGSEIMKYLDPNNQLSKELLNQKFDEVKIEAQKIYETLIKLEKSKEELIKSKKKEALKLKNDNAGETLKNLETPLIWISSIIKWMTAGEKNNILLAFLAYCSQIILCEPISVILIGDGATGKDHVKETAFKMIHKAFIIIEKMITQAAIFRRSQTNVCFYNGKIVDYGDLGGLNSHEEVESSKALMKELQTDGYLNKPLSFPVDGQWIVEDLELRGKPALTYTTVPNYNFDEQDKSRSIFISPRIDNREQFEKRYRILELKGTVYEKYKSYESDINMIKHMICHLRDIFRTPDGDMAIEIINPYVNFIIELFKDSPTFKRDIPKYENILKVIAILNYYKKKVYEHNGKKVIYISLEDVQLFFDIVNEHLKGINLNLSPKASDILEDLHENFDTWIENGAISEKGFTVDQYLEINSFDLKKRSLYAYFRELRDLGLIKINHNEGRLNFYTLSDIDLEYMNSPNFDNIDKEEIIMIAGEEIREFLEEDSFIDGLNINNQHEDIELPPWE